MRYSKIAARLGLAMLLATGLAACSQQDQGPYGGHTTAWYTKHVHKTADEFSWCRRMENENKHIPQPTCKNANTAFTAIALKDDSKVPPGGL